MNRQGLSVRNHAVSWLALLILAGTVLLLPAVSEAQSSVSGIVVDREDNPLAGVEVLVDPAGPVVLSNDRGQFRIGRLPRPPFTLRARRIGFVAASIHVPMAMEFSSIRFVLEPVAQPLATVRIDPERTAYSGRLSGYYSRLERRSGGVFITRDEIDKTNARSLSFVLERVPGLQLTRSRAGTTVLRFRGKSCRPLVWFDGVPMPSADVDINSFAPNTLHGVELYFGLSTVPAQYVGLRDQATCGTILLWSRGPDTEFRAHASPNPGDLERLVARLGAFTVENVDTPARPDNNRVLQVPYPPALFAERLRGRVVAEFVVNPQGRVEGNTIGIVSATHPLFAQAVRATLEAAAYQPAVKEGRNVFQLVQQSFDFSPIRGQRN